VLPNIKALFGAFSKKDRASSEPAGDTTGYKQDQPTLASDVPTPPSGP
jgi:hypothetical protein